ncbi:MAG: hypothetical protein QOE41_631, partial [Mycobacterium sp.]|nr:hypothetical protein [Mycobacterium sp.]
SLHLCGDRKTRRPASIAVSGGSVRAMSSLVVSQMSRCAAKYSSAWPRYLCRKGWPITDGCNASAYVESAVTADPN